MESEGRRRRSIVSRSLLWVVGVIPVKETSSETLKTINGKDISFFMFVRLYGRGKGIFVAIYLCQEFVRESPSNI